MKQYKKQNLLLIIIIFSLTHAIGQIRPERSDPEIRIQISPQISGDGFIIEATNDNTWMDDAFGFEIGSSYSMNLINNLWLNAGIGVFHSKNNINIYFKESQSLSFNIIKVPIGVGYDIMDWLRLNGGISIDYQYNNKDGQYISNQSGLSLNFAPTYIYSITDQFSLHAGLIFSHYSVISFNNDIYKDRIMTYGITIGLSTNL